jgi:hypothetical protein
MATRETYPPWWETLEEDPWYITGSKAVLGEREVEGMRKGEVMPWVETLAPLLFMGRGPKERPVWPGVTKSELELPPPTKKLLDAVREMPADTPPKYWGNINDRRYSGPLQGQQWADMYATPDMEFTVKPPFEEGVGPVDWNWYTPKGSSQLPPPGTPPASAGNSGIIDYHAWLRYQVYKNGGGHLPLEEWLKNPPPETPPKFPTKDDIRASLEKQGLIKPEEGPSLPPENADDVAYRRWLLENNPDQYWTQYHRGLLPGLENGAAFGPRGMPYENYENWNYAPRQEPNVPPPMPSPAPKLEPYDDSPAAELERILFWGNTSPGGQPYYPYSAQDAFNIGELGLKQPELPAGELQKGWLQWVQENAAKQWDTHEQPGGLFFKDKFPGYYKDYPYDPGAQPKSPERFLPGSPESTPPPNFNFDEFSYLWPQMRFYPETDWYDQLRDSQLYPSQYGYMV